MIEVIVLLASLVQPAPVLSTPTSTPTVQGRKGSKRVGGRNSHGKGSRYVGGRRR